MHPAPDEEDAILERLEARLESVHVVIHRLQEHNA